MSPDEWVVGFRLPEVELRPVDRLSLIRYAGASGDFNPIHTIDEEARAAGLPGVIQHGMLTMAQIGSLLSPYLHEGYIDQFQTRFAGMLFLGESLRLGARVTAAEPGDGCTRFRLDVYARTAEGRVIAKGALGYSWFGASRSTSVRASMGESTISARP